MTKPVDMTNQRFGKLLVIERGENDKFGKAQWWCQCDCGNKKLINGASLRKGLTKSCGCGIAETTKKRNLEHTPDETGNRYGKLTVICRNFDEEYQRDGRAMWTCLCDCGNIRVVAGRDLRSLKYISCGCETKSSGELKIEQILKSHSVHFAEEHYVKYNDDDDNYGFIDFIILDNNNQILYAIEYNGIQHYRTHGGWCTEEMVKLTQERDARKYKWLEENNIPLIIIPYTHLEKIEWKDLTLESNFLYKGKDDKND